MSRSSEITSDQQATAARDQISAARSRIAELHAEKERIAPEIGSLLVGGPRVRADLERAEARRSELTIEIGELEASIYALAAAIVRWQSVDDDAIAAEAAAAIIRIAGEARVAEQAYADAIVAAVHAGQRLNELRRRFRDERSTVAGLGHAVPDVAPPLSPHEEGLRPDGGLWGCPEIAMRRWMGETVRYPRRRSMWAAAIAENRGRQPSPNASVGEISDDRVFEGGNPVSRVIGHVRQAVAGD